MDMKTLLCNARERITTCKVCPRCDGKACAGQVPGMGGTLTGSAFTANTEALANVKLNMRLVHECSDPDTSFEFFGRKLATPILAAPLTNCVLNCGPAMEEAGFLKAIFDGARDAGSIGMGGDPVDDVNYEAALSAMEGADGGVIFIKPRMDLDAMAELFRQAENRGAVAVGTDLDGAGLITMRLKGMPVGPKSLRQLEQLRASTKLPFIVKGIMTLEDAKLCLDAGASAIVVSNHGGRVLDGTPGVAEVLPRIAEFIGGRIPVYADGSVRSGVDALKLLALGANAVLIGRPLCWGAYGGGAEGIRTLFETYTKQLYQAMIMTGCASLKDIGPHVIYR
ncbi:MAG: alpha-hydroxy-acid oxidizing protein [Clostridia bacterium]|nr:alpha-hydroxy-acid oxidizing protein [Clostridia bacterium]